VSASLVAPHQGLLEPDLLQAIRRALSGSPRRLPVECFYDDLGSALFEAITFLPEYGLTRAELRLLDRHADDLARRLPAGLDVVELGSGSGRKARVLLEALAARGPVRYRPVDISGAALEACAREVSHVGGVSVAALQQSHLEGLDRAVSERSPGRGLLVLFLGSNIGNFERVETARFLRSVRRKLRAGDALVVTADLEKDEARMLAAYDDALGVTAAFNLNALGRLNRELGADFDLGAFRHRAFYCAEARRIEMHLMSLAEQTAHVEALALTVRLHEQETIWTESSYKFRPGEIAAIGEDEGFVRAAEWADAEWALAQTLLTVR
jgi:L-histidine N-alpha-methyltransferase